MLAWKRRKFIALVGGGGLLLATKVRQARARSRALDLAPTIQELQAAGFRHQPPLPLPKNRGAD
jgi:hypothetical protein